MLNIQLFNTSNVTYICVIFCSCYGLILLELSSFSTCSVRNMHYMFFECSKFTTLDLSTFNTSNVTYIYELFSNEIVLLHLVYHLIQLML